MHPNPKRRLQKNPSRQLEFSIRELGFKNIAGVDEVGRGCLAGPVVAAAILLPFSFPEIGIRDSKQLTAKKRESLFEILHHQATAIGIGFVGAEEIDRINIAQASLKAMKLAVENLRLLPDYLLVDGPTPLPDLTIPQKPVIAGDEQSVTIAAASIIAKVTRDHFMQRLVLEYPEFSFHTHKGYGTQRHYEELQRSGPTPIHRRSFRLTVE